MQALSFGTVYRIKLSDLKSRPGIFGQAFEIGEKVVHYAQLIPKMRR
jgi:hypothetical protein